MVNSSGVVSKVLEFESMVQTQQLTIQAKVSKASEKASTLQSSLSGEMTQQVDAASSREKTYAGTMKIVSDCFLGIGALGGAITMGSLVTDTDALLAECEDSRVNAGGHPMAQLARGFVKSASTLGAMLLIVSRAIPKGVSGIMQADIQKREALIGLTQGTSSQEANMMKQLMELANSSTGLQRSMVETVSEILQSNTEASMV